MVNAATFISDREIRCTVGILSGVSVQIEVTTDGITYSGSVVTYISPGIPACLTCDTPGAMTIQVS